MKSSGFQVKSTQNLIKSDVSTKTLQFGGCMEGAMTPDFMKSRVIAPLLHSFVFQKSGLPQKYYDFAMDQIKTAYTI